MILPRQTFINAKQNIQLYFLNKMKYLWPETFPQGHSMIYLKQTNKQTNNKYNSFSLKWNIRLCTNTMYTLIAAPLWKT